MQSYVTRLGKAEEFVKLDDFIWSTPALTGVIAFLLVSAFGCCFPLVWVSAPGCLAQLCGLEKGPSGVRELGEVVLGKPARGKDVPEAAGALKPERKDKFKVTERVVPGGGDRNVVLSSCETRGSSPHRPEDKGCAVQVACGRSEGVSLDISKK